MSNSVSDSLNQNENHSLKLGDDMIKQYGNKEVKISFIYNKSGKSLKDILEQCYRDHIRNEQVLTGGKNDDLKKCENDVIMQA